MAIATPEKPSVPATNVMNICFAFLSQETVWQAIKLHVFDELDKNNEPVEVTRLASDLSLNAQALERLLNACTTMRLLVRTETDSKVSFSNSEETRLYLTKTSPYSLCDLFKDIDIHKVFATKMDDVLKKGNQLVLKKVEMETDDPDDIFASLYETKEKFHMFTRCMEAVATTGLHILSDLELQNFAHTVDLGGCLGVHARRLKSLYPDMKVTLADLKPVVEEAKACEANHQAGIQFAACDFKKAETLPEADLYLLSHILHDWNDDQCKLILQNVYQALNHGGCILIMEKVMNSSKTGFLMDNFFDLWMLIFTSGKERTEKEYKKLLTSAGFKDIKVHRDNITAVYDAILAYKK